MSIKKLLLTSTIIIVIIFGIMLLTSYAWYSLSGGSTAFDTNTYNEYIKINYETDEYINVSNAIPINDNDINNMSYNKFSVNTSSNIVSEVLLSISLSNISIDNELKSEYFKYQLLHNNKIISQGTGLDFNNTSFELTSKEVIYSDMNNNFIFRVWLSDNEQSQNELMNKTFSASIKVNAVKIRKTNHIIVSIEDLFNDGSEIKTVNIGGQADNPTVELNEKQGIMKDNYGNYRYYGADPHNWVEFNGEKWRIISIGNVKKNEEDEVGEQRIKLIRSTSIGDYSYDSSESGVNSGYGVNDWSKSDLMTELKTYYLNSSPNGTCYNGRYDESTTCNFSKTGLKQEGRDLIDDALYYLGGSSEYQELYADDYYKFERENSVYECNQASCGGALETRWTGKVGIMYPSDYTYATDLSVCTKDGNAYDNEDCKNNNWLYLGANEWTISPRSDVASRVFNVYSSGYVNYGNGINYTFHVIGVRPVVYLKTNVKIISDENANGTEDKPYKLNY